MQKTIVCCAIILNTKGELLIVKTNNSYLLPGGQPEGVETDQQTLKRELKEELNVDLVKAKFYKTYNFPQALNERQPLELRLYFAEVSGRFKPQNEVIDLIWINKAAYKQSGSFPKKFANVIFLDLKKDRIVDLID
jgi:8-oxo-dGTP diphosphatase